MRSLLNKVVFQKAGNEKGYTLYEALIALLVLTIGLVGLLSAIRRGVVGDVRAWDKIVKTNIALSRIEEHKASLYSEFVPGMNLPVLIPVPTSGPTPGVGFKTAVLNYQSSNELQINAVSNAITAQTGYGVSFSTPTISPTIQYYAVVNASPTPFMEWVSVNNRPACDQTNGDVQFTMTTPPGVNGTVALWFCDALGLQRQQSVWMNGVQRASYNPGSISATPSSPTTLSFTVNDFDTSSGALNFDIRQSGTAADWGTMVEDGNSGGISWDIFNNQNTPTFTPTPTACNLGVCNQVNPGSFTTSGGFSKNFSQTYVRVNSNSGTATVNFSVTCPGFYVVQAQVQSGRLQGGGTCNTELLAVMTGGSVSLTNGAAGSVTANWYMDPSVCGFQGAQTIRACGSACPDTSFANSAPATWKISTNGTYTLTLYPTANISNGYPHIYWVCLTQVSQFNTPTFTPTSNGTPTFTPTGAFNFPKTPIPINLSSFLNAQATPYVRGTPTSYGAFGCDPNLYALTASGIADSTGVVHWNSQLLSNVVFKTAGTLVADVRVMGGMSVTMQAITAAPSTFTTVLTPVPSIGWYEMTSASQSAGTTINYINFTFANASNSVTNFLALDSIRTIYPVPLNPNAVFMGASLSTVNYYRDAGSFAPYVVESFLVPQTVTGSAKGYQIMAVVHNGTISKYFTATPQPTATPGGTTPTPTPNTSPVPVVTVTDQFQPVTVIDSINQ